MLENHAKSASQVERPLALPEAAADVATSRRIGGWLSRHVREKKLDYFFQHVPKDAAILDFGCGDNWVRQWAEPRGWTNIVGIDRRESADVVGDIADWRDLGLKQHSFDFIVAFEIVEHGDFAPVLVQLLKPGGHLLATTPVPRFDWVCKILESLKVLQQRTGPHTHLVDLREYSGFDVVEHRVRGMISQWAILRPAGSSRSTDR